MSKGSRPRPCSVSQQEYDTRWDAIFNRDGLNDQLIKFNSMSPPLPEQLHTHNSLKQQLGVDDYRQTELDRKNK